jgi:Fur family peroxide stress response transcriptional regulator
MQKELDESTRQAFRRLCAKHKLRITPQRIAIYEELYRSGKHPSAEQLWKAVRLRYPHMSLDTVNRTLLTFAEIGLVEIVEGHGSPRRYDPNMQSHHHAYCIKCGSILDFASAEYDRLDIPANIKRQFKTISKRVILNGICAKCRHTV